MEQAEDFRAESRALHALIAPLDGAAMAQPTAFKGWTIDAVIQHLHFFNQAVILSIRDPEGMATFLAPLRAAMAGGRTMVDYTNEALDGLTGPALVATWAETCEATADAFLGVDPKARLKWAGPDMSARSSITARLMETWAHGQEIYDQLGVVREDADRIRNIAVLGVNTYGWTFANREETPPEPKPFVRLDAPSGAVWEFGEPSESERVEGSATEFCQVVAQTRNIADTSLKTTGPNATRWMAIAQCFAGKPETPPAPGVRGIRKG
ncbi:TIGR03084 family protein [Albimonas donghaensis]|uniref:TIGR03084 family protein n=1 Tax=Albimonas donghaensis TaxID=356660 RepID=A0A1H3AH29_9RHOB|nr:TIGR03084 family metal-binding protein [Albimonas donghaensis]SDX28905.1 TIGR03084 family protein [Albimonas donghaensis]